MSASQPIQFSNFHCNFGGIFTNPQDRVAARYQETTANTPTTLQMDLEAKSLRKPCTTIRQLLAPTHILELNWRSAPAGLPLCVLQFHLIGIHLV